MSFFDKNRDALLAKGIDPARLPPGQYSTERFPVLHAGVVPDVDLEEWDFTIGGLVREPITFSYDDVLGMPTETLEADIHCVTKWSKFDTQWEGVSVRHLWSLLDPDPTATHIVIEAYHGFTANLSIEDFLADGNLFAYRFDGEDLELEHGWPLRLVVPHLYFWKSVKWARGFRLTDADEPGFWERNGYHMRGDPFQEQRYWGD